jgi:inorganic phosphate transporter, PiT family
MTLAVAAFMILLAAANGSNDDAKGVATLGGAGVTRYRKALGWGVLATLAGALVSLTLAARLTKLFSKGIIAAHPTPAFALSVLIGTTAWVLLATATRLPVSTTHALVGAMVGAGVLLGPKAVSWAALTPKVLEPLLLSIVIAYGGSVLLNAIPGRVPECVCIGIDHAVLEPSWAGTPPILAFRASPAPLPVVQTGTAAECRAHGIAGPGVTSTVNGFHWLSAGAASFARGLNDTPKIVAVATFALVPGGWRPQQIAVVAAVAMAIGGILGGLRVARRLGDDIVTMDHLEGAKANLTSAVLVGLGATRGLPMSLTHVSTGAIAGAAGARPSRLNRGTLRDFALAWIVTPVVAGIVAAAIYLAIR